jgi:aspartate racemase
MKIVGIIGGIGPESTIQYYRQIINGYREKISDGSFPSVVINSIDMTKMLGMLGDKPDDLVEYLVSEIVKLEKFGVDFCVLASNTPHVVFEKLSAISPTKLISIVEVASERASDLRLNKVGLLGTKFTMTGDFYAKVFGAKNIEIASPLPEQQDYIHKIYFDELVKGEVRSETKRRLLDIIQDMKNKFQIEGVVLGGTELSLILKKECYFDIPVLDTTSLHIKKIVSEIIN